MTNLDPHYECIRVREKKSLKAINYDSKSLIEVIYRVALYKKMGFYYVADGKEKKIYFFLKLEMARRFFNLKAWHKELKYLGIIK